MRDSESVCRVTTVVNCGPRRVGLAGLAVAIFWLQVMRLVVVLTAAE